MGVAFSMDRSKDAQFLYLNTDKPKDITDRDITISNFYDLRLGADYLFRPGKRFQPFVGVYAVAMSFGDVEKSTSRKPSTTAPRNREPRP